MRQVFDVQNAVVIDDEPFILKLLARQLTNLGATRVQPFERAADALALLSSGAQAVDLICCDLQMPEMDGIEFMRHLAGLGYKGALILISGEHDRIVQTARKLASSHQLNVLGALNKPVKPEALQELLTLMKNRPSAQPRRAPAALYPVEEVRRAIDDGELVNHYQPKVSLNNGEVVGVETLVRWQHPSDGMVYPDRFISVAEDHGLIDDLTRNVLGGALQQARHWQAAGLLFPIAVNVSIDNLGNHQFPDDVVAQAKLAGVPTSRLMLEVTESRLMSDALATIDVLTRLRLKRIGLSIDDFGTGHSSLAQLRDIPFEELKIDRSFVHGAAHDSSLNAILQASLHLAQELGMKTVAEGVEDLDDWCHLRVAGCDHAQGYFIGKPMAAENLPAWINDWHQRKSRLLDFASSGFVAVDTNFSPM